MVLGSEPDRGTRRIAGTGVGRHHDDDIAEICLAPVVVGQRTVVHHLQQQVENIRVRLFDLIEQQDRMRVLVDLLGQQTALVEADVARRGTDQTRHGVAFHVLRHIEPDQLEAEHACELSRHLGLADPGRAGEEETADRLVLVSQTGAVHPDC